MCRIALSGSLIILFLITLQSCGYTEDGGPPDIDPQFTTYPLTFSPVSIENREQIRILVPKDGRWLAVNRDKVALPCEAAFRTIDTLVSDLPSLRFVSDSVVSLYDQSDPLTITWTTYLWDFGLYKINVPNGTMYYGRTELGDFYMPFITICRISDDGISRSEVVTTFPVEDRWDYPLEEKEFTSDTVVYHTYEVKFERE